MNILHLDSSALGAASASRELGAAVVRRLRTAHPAAQVRYRDLDASPLPHLSAATLSGADSAETGRAEEALAEVFAADVIVIGAPMYNFGIPSTLKAWIDRIAVAGRTFRYTADGPEGLLRGKCAVLALTQGGVHAEGGPSEHHESYLKWMLGFLGITEVDVVRAQVLALGGDAREQAMAGARRVADATFAEAA